MCEMFQMGAHTLCWHGGRFCLWALSGINTFVLSSHPLYLYFFVFGDYSLCFLCKLSPPHVRNTHLPILGTLTSPY
jgi:hypothetical protein